MNAFGIGLLARLGYDGDGTLPVADFWFSSMASAVLRLTALALSAAVILLALGYVFYFLQTLPWRRRERAVGLLDLMEAGLRTGASAEQTVIAVCGTRDATLPVRLHLLAAHLESGLSLADSLARTPRLLPPAVQSLLELGVRHGVLARVLPACRTALDEPPQPRAVAVQIIAFYFILSAFQCLSVLGLLRVAVLPKFRVILEDMVGMDSSRLGTLMSAAAVVGVVNLVVGGVFALWLFARMGGPRVLEGKWVRGSALLDRLLLMVPWRRARMRRDFASALAVLLDCGIPESVAVQEAAQATGSRWFRDRADDVSRALSRGVPLTEALAPLEDAGELRWRMTNARHGRSGFQGALRGWLEALDARAHAQEHSAAQGFVTVGLLIQGLAVGLAVTGIFSALVHLTEGAVNW